MTALSKVLWDYLRTANCTDMIHSGTCTANAKYQLYRSLISNAKYYALLIALPAIAKFRDLNQRVFEDTLRYYVEGVLTGTAIGWTTEVLVCVFRHLLGEFRYYSVLFLPAVFGSSHIFWSSKRVQRLHTLSIFQCTVESILMRRTNILTRTIANSKFLQTLLFMSCSSIILQAKQTGFYKGFWLLTPDTNPNICEADALETNLESIPKQDLTKICTHKEESCTLHLIKGVRSYFAFGITLDFLKALISNTPKDAIGFMNKFLAKLQNFKLNSTALLASYIGIYRLTNCFLNRKTKTNTTSNHIAAGFLSGVCYIFMPKLTCLSYALVITIQIMWQYLKSKNADKQIETNYLKTIMKIPYGKIFFPFCLAHLIHYYCLHSNGVSDLSQIIINNTTDFYAQNLGSRAHDVNKFLTAAQ